MARLLLSLPLLALIVGCGSPLEAGGNAVASVEPTASSVEVAATPPPASPIPAAATTPSSARPLSCEAEIGAAAAAKRVALCRDVSPATHPPCNAKNSCGSIEGEIARSCALFEDKGEPMTGCGPAPKSSEAAAAVVTRYYSAINSRDYSTAWQAWGDDGPPNQSLAAFTKGFADTRSTTVKIGKLSPSEGGAGSIYQTVPVTVDATLNDGTHQRFSGDYTIRRVNGVDGATPDQLRWHIDSAHLKPVR